MQSPRTRRPRRLALALAWILCGALLYPSAGSAQEDGADPSDIDTTRAGAYVGLALAGGIPAFDGAQLFTITTPSQGSVDEDPSVGINARVGWRFASWGAAELQYEWMNEFVVNTRGEECAKAKAQVLTGNLKLLAPRRSFHPYALAGVGAGRYERETRTIAIGAGSCSPNPGQSGHERDWGFAARLGLGVDLYITEHVLLNLEGSGLYSEENPLDHSWPYISLSAGVQYRF